MSDYKSNKGTRKPYGDKPEYKGKGTRKPYGEKSDFTSKGGRKPYGDKPEYKGGRKPYGDKPEYKGGRKPYGDKPEYKGGRKPYGDKPDFRSKDTRKPYGDKPEYKGGRKFDRDDSQYSPKRDYDEKPVYHEETSIQTPEREDELPFLIMGRNAVREAIKSGRSIDKILVVAERDGSLGEIVSLARDNNILLQEVDRAKLDEICMPFGHGDKPGNHQGIVARVPGADYVEISDILNYAKEKNEKPFIILLDGITDPYNFGSIIRSAECAGVHGIIIPKRRSATLTSSAVKVSAGAASHMRVAKVPNIAGAIDRLKEEGIWIAGTDMGGQSMYETDMKGALALVIGSEGEGLSELVRKKCDYIVSAPIKGHVDSLNAAVASAVVMYEKVRQDMNG